MERREAFKRWLQNERIKKTGRPIPEKTIESYLRSIHRLSDAMYEEGVISKRLYSMQTVDELNAAFKEIKKERTYLEMNTASENKLHKALNYYTRFVEISNEKAEDEKAAANDMQK